MPSNLDQRIPALANAMIVNAHARNRYDEAIAIQQQLQDDYGYTLQMKASGADPLADFLFNVKQGHCEYFASAMVVLLRSRGIAARIVNGFLPGEFNEAAGAYTVRESDAHSWVEVYFPQTHAWITFDPTPAAGRTEPLRSGFGAKLGKYAEALELIWFQYVVGYDKQEQRSLATSLHNHVFDYGHMLSQMLADLRRNPLRIIVIAIVVGAMAVVILVFVLLRRAKAVGWRRALLRATSKNEKRMTSGIIFYERLLALLHKRGIERDVSLTPLEFASTLSSPAVTQITEAYIRVRYGRQDLTANELRLLDKMLRQFESEVNA
ncbi:MAG: DUF4129 domain-containing transglutaminase family protein [Pyrinomonadaceae bacterium]